MNEKDPLIAHIASNASVDPAYQQARQHGGDVYAGALAAGATQQEALDIANDVHAQMALDSLTRHMILGQQGGLATGVEAFMSRRQNNL